MFGKAHRETGLVCADLSRAGGAPGCEAGGAPQFHSDFFHRQVLASLNLGIEQFSGPGSVYTSRPAPLGLTPAFCLDTHCVALPGIKDSGCGEASVPDE